MTIRKMLGADDVRAKFLNCERSQEIKFNRKMSRNVGVGTDTETRK